MIERKVLITGPLTDDDVRDVVLLLQRIEEQRPTETFRIVVDDAEAQETADEMEERLARLNPQRPGYRRVVETYQGEAFGG